MELLQNIKESSFLTTKHVSILRSSLHDEEEQEFLTQCSGGKFSVKGHCIIVMWRNHGIANPAEKVKYGKP